MASVMKKKFSLQEVTAHASEEDCWVVVDGEVWDVTKFLKLHPGGRHVLLQYAGKDATEAFYSMHMSSVLDKYRQKFVIGRLEGTSVLDRQLPRRQVPHAELRCAQGYQSKYVTEDHVNYMYKVRQWYYERISPIEEQVERKNAVPKGLYKECGEAGLLPSVVGIYPWPSQFCPTVFGGVPPQNWDIWYEYMFYEGLMGGAVSNWLGNLLAGPSIGLPPVLKCQPHIRDRVCSEVLQGDKRICLCISEAFAGSDVANIQTTARKSPCGKFYIVNGSKKWITSGHKADYFTCAVRTGGDGMMGISMLLVPRLPGVKTRKMNVQTQASETAYITFDDVKVPVDHLIGRENQGFRVIMVNFNHERWGMCLQSVRLMRNMVTDCLLWANQRKVFGKKLYKQPVIRYKLADMVSRLESSQSWLNEITHQMATLPKKKMAQMMAGPIALLKYRTTSDVQQIVMDAVQVFGGRGMTRDGMGKRVFRAQQFLKQLVVTGGSAEVMADLGIRQTFKLFPRDARL